MCTAVQSAVTLQQVSLSVHHIPVVWQKGHILSPSHSGVVLVIHSTEHRCYC